MSRGRGTGPVHLNSIQEYWGGVTFRMAAQTAAGQTTYRLFPGGAPFKCRVIGLKGIMTGAGGAGDTVQLKDGDGNAITDSISVAALQDKDTFEEAQIDNDQWDINAGEEMNIITASDALAYVTVECVRSEEV